MVLVIVVSILVIGSIVAAYVGDYTWIAFILGLVCLAAFIGTMYYLILHPWWMIIGGGIGMIVSRQLKTVEGLKAEC